MKKNKMIAKPLLLIMMALFFLSRNAWSATVDTVSIYSNKMHTSAKCVVIIPSTYYQMDKQYPVVYLLHGYGGNYSNWVDLVPKVKNYADQFDMIIVCPDGNFDSWYIDSPIDSTKMYDTYISKEVPAYIDSAFRTIAKRECRAITGLSMGGQGALSLAWKHAHFFGAAGSMSGVQNLVPWKNKYGLTEILGDTLQNENFKSYSVVTLVKTRHKQVPALIFGCGVNDPFIETNRKLHAELLALHIPHDYIERNGTHNWQYWGNAIGYHLLFFHKYFSRHQ